MREAVREGRVSSAHDIAEGGLAVALAECCLAGGIGAQVELREELWEALAPTTSGPGSEPTAETLLAAALFGEGPGGFLLSGEADALHALGEQVTVVMIGRVGEDLLSIVAAGATAGTMLTLTLDELARAHSSFSKLFS